MSNRRTGGQVIADHLAANGVPWVVGIPGHGNLPMVDAYVDRDQPRFLQVRHEQSAAHLADAYFRVSRRPLAVMTSIGPGAVNTAVGIASAYVDSSCMLVFTGDVHTYMFGRGVLQEVERKAWADLVSIFEPITKRSWQVTRVDQLARVMPQAFALATGGRPGPGAGVGAHGRPGGRRGCRAGARGGDAHATSRAGRRGGGHPERPRGRAAAHHPGRRRRGPVGCRPHAAAHRRAPGHPGRGHLPGQGRPAGAPPAVRLVSRVQGDRHGQHPVPRGGCHPRHRLPLRRRGHLLLRAGRDLLHPAHPPPPGGHRRVRDRQELPGGQRRGGRCRGVLRRPVGARPGRAAGRDPAA